MAKRGFRYLPPNRRYGHQTDVTFGVNFGAWYKGQGVAKFNLLFVSDNFNPLGLVYVGQVVSVKYASGEDMRAKHPILAISVENCYFGAP